MATEKAKVEGTEVELAIADEKAKAPKDVGTEISFNFEDAKPEVFKFKLPEHYWGREVYPNCTCDHEGFHTFHGTRDEVAPRGRLLTRFYGARLVK